MPGTQTSPKSRLLTDLPPYIYGTTRLGDENIPFEDRVSLARAAMEGVDWFHTSHTYGNALQVLRAAFDQDRTRVPKLIVKIGWSRTAELREVIHQNIEPLPEHIRNQIVQLHYRWSDELDMHAEIWTL